MENVNTELLEAIVQSGHTLADVSWVVLELADESWGNKPVATINTDNIDDALSGFGGLEYDDGYGSQMLFGTLVFNDHTWLERGEYDGSEWWTFCQVPVRPGFKPEETQVFEEFDRDAHDAL